MIWWLSTVLLAALCLVVALIPVALFVGLVQAILEQWDDVAAWEHLLMVLALVWAAGGTVVILWMWGGLARELWEER